MLYRLDLSEEIWSALDDKSTINMIFKRSFVQLLQVKMNQLMLVGELLSER